MLAKRTQKMTLMTPFIRESEEVETIAGKVASACTEEGLKEVTALLFSSLGLSYCNVPVCRQ